MNIILDAICIIIFALAVIRAYRKGFFKSLLDFAGGIISLILACLFSDTLAAFLKDTFLFDSLKNRVLARITEMLPSGEGVGVLSLLANPSEAFTNLLKVFGTTPEALSEKLSVTGEAAINEKAAEYIVEPMVNTISGILSFVLILIISFFVIKLIGLVVDKILKLPVLNSANKLLGVLIGVLLGAFYVYVFALLLDVALPFLQSSGSEFFSSINPGESTVLAMFYKYNPIAMALRAVSPLIF